MGDDLFLGPKLRLNPGETMRSSKRVSVCSHLKNSRGRERRSGSSDDGTKTLNSGQYHSSTAQRQNTSIYKILTLHRWESLNLMNYRIVPLRVVHGNLAMKYLDWVVTQQQQHQPLHKIIHIYCITIHILVRARMYTSAKAILHHLSKNGNISTAALFNALMDTYRCCNSNPSVFDLLIKTYINHDANHLTNAMSTFRSMTNRGFKPSVCSCNSILSAIAKCPQQQQQKMTTSVWVFFKEIIRKRIRPNVITFNTVLNSLFMDGKFQKGHYLLEEMVEIGCKPTTATYNILLNCYFKKGKLKDVSRVIGIMRSSGIKADVYTYNILIRSLCEDSRASRAYLCLGKMRKQGLYPNEITYNTIIYGFCKENNMEIATKVVDEMISHNLMLNPVTYNTLIHGYCRNQDMDSALRLLKELEEFNLPPDEASYAPILDGFCKISMFDAAVDLLEKMKLKGVVPNRVIYTILIDGFCKKGFLFQALQYFTAMFESGIDPDVITYSSLVNGFCKQGKLTRQSQGLLCRMVKVGVPSNAILQATLIHNSCKQGNIMEAMEFYTNMHHLSNGRHHTADLITCNTIITGLCRNGYLREAEEFMHHMSRMKGLPNSRTFDCLINGHCTQSDRPMGSSLLLLDEMVKQGHSLSIYTYGILLKGICRGGTVEEAKSFFCNKLLSIPSTIDNVTCNTLLLKLFSKDGSPKDALALYDAMVENDILPDNYTYTILINGFCNHGKLVLAMYILNIMIQRKIFPVHVAYTCIMDGLLKNGHQKAAFYLFQEMTMNSKNNDNRKRITPDVATFNTMIDGYSKAGQKVEILVPMMLDQGVFPNLITYNILLHGNSKKKDLSSLFYLYKMLIRQGFVPDRITYHALIEGLYECGLLDHIGLKFLEKMNSKAVAPDRSTFHMLLARFTSRVDIRNIFRIVTCMNNLGLSLSKDAYNVIINRLIRKGFYRESYMVLHEMIKKGFIPEISHFIAFIKRKCKLGDIYGAFQIRDEVETLGLVPIEVAESIVIRGLCQYEKLEEALIVFDNLIRRGLVPTAATFTTLIHGLCRKKGKIDEALYMKEVMEDLNLKPDVVTYNVVIAGLFNQNHLNMGFEMYKEMKQIGVLPNVATYRIMLAAAATAVASSKEIDISTESTMVLQDMQDRGFIPSFALENHCQTSSYHVQKQLHIAMRILNFI